MPDVYRRSIRLVEWVVIGPDEFQPIWADSSGTWRGKIRKFVACQSCGEYSAASGASPWLGLCCAR